MLGPNSINLAFVQSLCIERRVSSAASVLLWSELICIDLPTIDLYWSDLYHQSWNHQLSVCSPDAGIWTLGPTEPWSQSPFLDLSICFNFIFVFVYWQHFYSGQCWVQPSQVPRPTLRRVLSQSENQTRSNRTLISNTIWTWFGLNLLFFCLMIFTRILSCNNTLRE